MTAVVGRIADRGMMMTTSQAQKCDPLDADVSAFHRNGHYFLWPHRKKWLAVRVCVT